MPGYDTTKFSPPAPVALVTLRHHESGASLENVPMLIDSGADVTLVPRDSAIRLGAVFDPEKQYELVGFDGSSSVAPAVQLHLLLLRRTFKGQFLVIDQAWGIIGRDILNHVAILLDGPRLSWDEHR